MSDIDIEISKLIERMHGIDKVINNLQSERSIIQKSFSKIQHDRKILLDSLMKNVPSVPIISANTANSVSTPSVAPTILLTESEKIRKRKNETILKLQEQAKRKKGIHDDEPKAHKNKATTAEYKEKDDDQSTSKIQEMRNLAKGIKQATKIISPIQQLIRSEEKKKVKKHRLEHSETKSDDINHSKESDYKEEHKTKDTKSAISSGEPNSKHTSKPKKNFDSMMDAIDKTESTKKHKNSHKSHKPSKIFKLDEDQVMSYFFILN